MKLMNLIHNFLFERISLLDFQIGFACLLDEIRDRKFAPEMNLTDVLVWLFAHLHRGLITVDSFKETLALYVHAQKSEKFSCIYYAAPARAADEVTP